MTLGNRTIERRILLAALAGFILGSAWLITLRFATWKSTNVHYHANFALYVNGQKDTFNSFTFYEEVQSCGSDDATDPKVRVHMHDQNNHIVHVHDGGVTWGDFFANLGYTLGDTVLKTDKGMYVDADGNKLTFMLNNEKVIKIANRTIGSEDVLLINYGNDDDATLTQRYNEIPKDAHEYNQKNDPSTCSGSKPATLSERLHQAIGIN